jgi:hypothetical protein
MQKPKILKKNGAVSRPKPLALRGLFLINGDLDPNIYPECVLLSGQGIANLTSKKKRLGRKWAKNTYRPGTLTLALQTLRKGRKG